MWTVMLPPIHQQVAHKHHQTDANTTRMNDLCITSFHQCQEHVKAAVTYFREGKLE